ncbi:MAG: hypothetical protein K2J11_06845 [Oscillospiraceae bacterium]|nr:hypothetical protein [Oscillospiraceae bacterium]
MAVQMKASFDPAYIAVNRSGQSVVLTLTNSGSESIDFRGSDDSKVREAPDGIDMFLSCGDGGSELCTKDNMGLLKAVSKTGNWDAVFKSVHGSVYEWTFRPRKSTFIAAGEFIKIEIGSVNTNGASGTVPVKFILHTSSSDCNFSADLNKICAPEITRLSAKVTKNLNRQQFVPADTVLGSESEGFQAMPYVWPPPPPEPKHKKMVCVEWETRNAVSCSLRCGSGIYSQLAASGSTVISADEDADSVTLTAYSEHKAVFTEKTVSIEN